MSDGGRIVDHQNQESVRRTGSAGTGRGEAGEIFRCAGYWLLSDFDRREGRQHRIDPQKPTTIARSLAIGNPADGHYAIKCITESGGWSEDVSDPELVECIQLLAETEGVFTETAGGVTVGTARKLYRQGRISPDETTVLCITGNGLKTTDVLAGKYELEEPIAPKIAEFEKYMENGRWKRSRERCSGDCGGLDEHHGSNSDSPAPADGGQCAGDVLGGESERTVHRA